ncbi:hypothetical protein ABC766_29335 [Methylobacterium fujisawaense]|uniref:hypothetical protein n=1 Tax=Methylobacterium fujisawaense TaxID=107400 RepID=UPI0031F58D75
MMPNRTQIIVCWLAFTGLMALVSILLHAFVPSVMISLQNAIGVGTLGVLMLIGWLALAIYAYRPLLRDWLARRRGTRVRER